MLNIGDATWYHANKPNKQDIEKIKNLYDLHEIIQEDISDLNTQDKIDIYDDAMFLVLHFPKYDVKTNQYYSNEFNVILWKKFIISLTKFKTNHVDKIRKEYEEDIKQGKQEFKHSPYYVLYVMIDVMYDKAINTVANFNQDLQDIESKIFSWQKYNQYLLEKLLIKRRNIIFLKHTFQPQEEILEELNKATIKFYWWDLDVYFEDLQYKHDKIMRIINVSTENIETLSDTYNSLANIKTNSMIAVLTIFTAILWMMTFITGFFGMNVGLPGQNNIWMYLFIVLGMFFVTLMMLLVFKRKKRL